MFYLSFILLWGCSSEDEPQFDPLNLDAWLGEYEIDTIGTSAVSCEDDFLQGELLTLGADGTFQVISLCSGATLTEGSFSFQRGLFSVFASDRVQTPEDFPEFEMQIFDDQEGRITIYRCPFRVGSCTIRKGRRL